MNLLNFAKAYVVLFILSMLFTKFSSKKQFVLFWSLFVLSLSVMAYNMIPPGKWDISWHSTLLNQIRGSEISFFDFLFKNDSLIGGAEYTSLLTFNILRYIVVRTSQNNLLLPAICAFIDYSILGYIIMDWSLQNAKCYKISIFTLLLNFAFTPYVHAISGMRNILSSYIIGLAVYLYIYKKKHIILLIILTFVAVTIHPASVITFPFIFLAKLKMGSIGFASVFIVSALAKPVAQLMSYSNIYFLSLIGNKYIAYTSETQYRASRIPLYGVLIITTVFLIIYFLLYRRFNTLNNQSDKKTLYNFIALYMIYIWANIGNYDMVLRPAYVLGVLAPVLSSFLSDEQLWTNKGLKSWSESVISFGATAGNLLICFIVNYSFYVQLKDVL